MSKKQQTMLAEAIALASSKHAGQTDRAGLPYILHPLKVMASVRLKDKDPVISQIAVLHDVLEDTDTRVDHLLMLGFSGRTIEALEALTHRPGQTYSEYIDSIISHGRDAIIVKMADLKHNSDITRLKGVSEKDVARVAKYHAAYIKLKKELKRLPR